MVNKLNGLKRTLLALGITFILGCGGVKPSETTDLASTAESPPVQPEDDFIPFDTARTEVELPFLVDSDGAVDLTCFKKVDKPSVSPAGEEVSERIESNAGAVTTAFLEWIRKDFEMDGLDPDTIDGWMIEVVNPEVTTVSKDDLRFEKDQECIGENTAKLPKNTDAVVTIVGAREFAVTSKKAIGIDDRQEMVSVLGEQDIVLESENIFVWEVAKDAEDKVKVDEKGEELYLNQEGKLIPESQVPSKADRGMKAFTLKAASPVYFAYAKMDEEYIRREGKKDNCDVFLVWGDKKPRAPECEEFQESGFSAVKKGEDVKVTIKTGKKKKVDIISYGEPKMIRIDDRIIVWLNPKKIEEGVLLRVNSLVLSPEPLVAPPVPVQEARVVQRAPAVKEAPAEVDKTPPPPAKPEPSKPGKKKSEKTDQQSIDEYLSQ